MKMNGSDRHDTIAEINVVPLVDIVLVILIIFMVSAPIFIKPSININLPQAVSGKEEKPSNLNITINSEGLIDYNGEIVSLEQLADRASIDVKKNPDISAVIAADKMVPHGTVIEILDSLQMKGIKKFAINVQVPQ